jgi:hypothetical protein
MKKIILILLLLVMIDFAAAIHINEIMYNPVGMDNNKEFVEIYGINNLSGFIIADAASNDSLVLMQFVEGNNYSLITEEGFNYSALNCSVYSAGATIGDNLNNNNDTITLYYNGSAIDSVFYNGSLANGNGYSLELYNNTWVESLVPGGTPGGENHVYNITANYTNSTNSSNNSSNSSNPSNTSQGKDIKLSVYLDDVLFKGLTYDKLFKLENLDDEPGIDDNITVLVYYNITKNNETNQTLIKEGVFNKTINSYSTTGTGSFFANDTGNYTLCGWIINSSVNDTNLSNNFDCKDFVVVDTDLVPCNISLNLSTDKFIYNNSEAIKIYNVLSNGSYPFFIEYWIEDLFSNIIKERYNTSNTASKSYSPDISEADAVLVIKNRLAFIACNNSNNKTENSVMVIVKNEKQIDSNITILEVYTGSDNTIKFGEILKVKLDIYKGDTSKTAVEAWLEKNKEKISYVSSFNANKKFADYDATVPVVVKPDCEKDYSNGTYTLIIQGFDLTRTAEVNVEGRVSSMCKETIVLGENPVTQTTEKKKQYEIMNFSKSMKQNETLKVTVRINNIEDEKSHYKVWSYIYRGSKSYSGNRTDNLVEFDLAKAGTKDITLKNTFQGEPGDYKLMVKINKNSQKTNYSLSENITVEEAPITVVEQEETLLKENLEKSEKDLNSTSVLENSITGNTVVYESKNTKLKNNLAYWIVAALSIIVLVLIKRHGHGQERTSKQDR